jgi:hypothetical protein
VLDNSSVIPEVGPIPEHDFDAVAIEVQNGSVEVTILVDAGGRCAVRPTASGQSSGVEVSDGSPAMGGEGNVRCAGFYAVALLV